VPEHPFAAAYPWHRPEAMGLYAALTTAYVAPNEIDLLLKRAGDGRLDALNLAQPPGGIWKDGLEALGRLGQVLKLCEDLTGSGKPAVQAAARVVLDARPLTGPRSEIHQRYLRGGRLTLNRSGLRRRVEQLSLVEGSDARRVLVVRGGPKTGKTWSRHLFERAAKASGADFTYIAAGMVGSAQILVDKLFSLLQGSDLAPAVDSTSTAGYQQVCFRLHEAAFRYGRPLWIAVDDLGPGADGVTPIMNPDIRDFLIEFALQLTDPRAGGCFRLMLLHYPEGQLPTYWDDDLWEEDRTVDLGLDDVVAVLRAWSADSSGRLIEDEWLRLAADIVAMADADDGSGKPRLRRLHDAVSGVLAELDGQPR
jgi:hypothetical protein